MLPGIVETNREKVAAPAISSQSTGAVLLPEYWGRSSKLGIDIALNRILGIKFATKAPPGMYFEPAASFSETAIEPQSPQKEAAGSSRRGPYAVTLAGDWGAIRDCLS